MQFEAFMVGKRESMGEAGTVTSLLHMWKNQESERARGHRPKSHHPGHLLF